MRQIVWMIVMVCMIAPAWGQDPNVPAVPAGWHKVASCGAGDASKELFVTQGEYYTYSAGEVPLAAVAENNPCRRVIFGSQVVCSFDGMVASAAYKVLVSYLSDSPDREQSLSVDEKVLQDQLKLPDDQIASFLLDIPQTVYADGRMDITAGRISGPNAVICRLEIYSADPTLLKPMPALQYADPNPVLTPMAGDIQPINLNGRWRFNPAVDIQGPFEKLDVSAWKEITVPSHWAMQGFTVAKNGRAACQRDLDVPLEWQGRQIKLRFDAIFGDAMVYINGQRAGSHQGTFTPFEVDITKLVHPGRRDSVVVTVQSDTQADMLASGSQYAVFPLYGIIRSVRLFAVPQAHLSSLHVETDLDDQYKNSDLHIYLTLANNSPQPVEQWQARFKLDRWPAGPAKTLNPASVQLSPVPAGQSVKQRVTIPVILPEKWDCEHPNLYVLTCELVREGRVVETVQKRFGFREVQVSGNRLLVNGVPVKLHGVNRHESHPAMGRALDPAAGLWRKDAEMYKQMNCNYIRTSHYPPAEEFIDACDEVGLFVEEEAPFCWVGHQANSNWQRLSPFNPGYVEPVSAGIAEMIERDRSHPSIIFWSLANESSWSKVFARAFEYADKADPSRPKSFHDQSWGSYNNNGSLTQLANYHYPGPGGPEKVRDSQRPVLFGEYCHLNCYNRQELYTDPGVRDAWGLALAAMWEDMYASPGCLGGAIWSGIDDSFVLPDGKIVGYGAWGPVDGWRRPRAEAWHVYKAYSPVRISCDPNQPSNDSTTLVVQNRFLFTDLKECRIEWKYPSNRQGTVQTSLPPGAVGLVTIPVPSTDLYGHPLEVCIYDQANRLVDQYAIQSVMKLDPPLGLGMQESSVKDSLVLEEKQNKLIVVTDQFRMVVDKAMGSVEEFKYAGHTVIAGGPHLMLLPNISQSSSVLQMQGDDVFAPATDACTNWKCREVRGVQVRDGVDIAITGVYDQAEGCFTLHIKADGSLIVDYDFVCKSDIDLRQLGLVFDLPVGVSNLTWQRQGLWNYYPPDHIGRLEGQTPAFYDTPKVNYAGPRKEPKTPWSQDDSALGSNDFRSTKTNILSATLRTPDRSGLMVISDGKQSVRAWVMKERTHLLVADYSGLGGEGFLGGHARKWARTVKAGDKVTGIIRLQPVH